MLVIISLATPVWPPIVERYFHCGVCWNGDYDLCQACVEFGAKCEGNHPLEVREWRP